MNARISTLIIARKNFTKAFIKDINREIEEEDEKPDDLYDPLQAPLLTSSLIAINKGNNNMQEFEENEEDL